MGTATVMAVVGSLAAGYVLGRLRLRRRLGHWAEEQVRFAGPWVRNGGRAGQTVVVLVHGLTRPRRMWRLVHASPRELESAPVYDPNWTNRT